MIVHGGHNFHVAHHGDMWELDLATLAWSPVAYSGEAPGPRYGHSMVLYDPGRDPMLVVFGGVRGATAFSNHMFLYHLETRHWVAVRSAFFLFFFLLV